MKKMKNNSAKVVVATKRNEEYEYVDKNIYRTNGKYRVRVGDYSGYETTLERAKKLRTRFRKAFNSEPVFG